MQLILATSNKGKVREIQALCKEFEVIPYSQLIEEFEIVEDGESFKENALIKAKLREIRLQKAHEAAMDELLNGDDRRRKAEEEREYERNLLKNLQNHAYATSLQNQMPVSGSFGKPLMATPHPVGPGTWHEVKMTTETTNTGVVGTIKKALGI